jgi:hypothetical protein
VGEGLERDGDEAVEEEELDEAVVLDEDPRDGPRGKRDG